MKHFKEAIENWLTLIALCAFAGFMAFVNHTALQEMTARKMAVTMMGSIFLGIVTVLFLDGMDWTDKQKLGAAVFAGYMAMPILHGFYKLAEVFQKDPEKWIKK
jgi:hypothetical protein